jgi:peptidoglycan/LPS O-acetylase OafA/YrhL
MRSRYYSSAAQDESSRVSEWDGWRGIAIALVLCGHFADIKWLWEDRMGVDVFFVLSGMLMSIILFEKRMPLKRFYLRRFSRIYPAFFVCVVSMYLVGWLFGLSFSLTEFFSNLVFMRTYLPADPHIWDTHVAVKHMWSLNVEEHAYVLLSLLTMVIVARRSIAMVLIAAALFSMLWSTWQYTRLDRESFELHLIRTEASVVFIFVSAAYCVLRRKYNWRVAPAVPVSCLLLSVICYMHATSIWLVYSVCPILLALTVNHLQDLPARMRALLSAKPLRMLGIWSFSIYLWQQFFYQYAWKVQDALDAYGITSETEFYGRMVGLVVGVLFGIISFYCIEQPIRTAINRWSPNKVPKVRALAVAQS